jgi:hypothetical protein
MPSMTWAIHLCVKLTCNTIARVPAIAGGVIWLFHVKNVAKVPYSVFEGVIFS